MGDGTIQIRSRHPDLILGTAQFGSWYGIANRVGMPTAGDATDLLDKAWDLGIRWLDTARSYQVSEARIGDHQRSRPAARRFHIATKLAATLLPPGPRAKGVGDRALHSWATSRTALARHRFDVIMAHRAGHLSHPAIRRFLGSLRHRGLVSRIGVSVQSVAEFRTALADPLIQHVQLPFNLLDDRWLSFGIQRTLMRRPDIVVHARSAFLQGLLLLDDTARWPAIPGVDPDDIRARLDRLVMQTGRQDRLDLCLAHVRAQPWITGVVIGADTPHQLAEIADRFARPPLDSEQVGAVRRHFAGMPEDLVNPAAWRRYRPQASPRASTTRTTSASDKPT